MRLDSNVRTMDGWAELEKAAQLVSVWNSHNGEKSGLRIRMGDALRALGLSNDSDTASDVIKALYDVSSSVERAGSDFVVGARDIAGAFDQLTGAIYEISDKVKREESK